MANGAVGMGFACGSGKSQLHGHGSEAIPRRLTNQFHAATNPEFGEQRRDMEFDSAFGKIQARGNLFVSETAHDAIEDFFFAAGELDGAADGMAGLKKFFSFFVEAFEDFGLGFNHDDVVCGGLAAHHAVHGEQAGSLVDREVTIRAGLDMKMSDAGVPFVEIVQVARYGWAGTA